MNCVKPETEPAVAVAAFYKFVELKDLQTRQAALRQKCQENGVRGIILLAPEGINATIAGPMEGVDAVLSYLREDPLLQNLEHKTSYAPKMPFLRLKVRLKKEIIRMNQPHVNPAVRVGQYVAPKDWNALIAQPGVTLIDTRNDYEVLAGTFKGGIDPQIRTFTEFAQYASTYLDPKKHPKIAMWCTGGIRCEKASAYLLEQGFPEVYHLQGGILKYLEEVPASESLWEGECFVFDQRVSVGHNLKPGEHQACYGCRRPITEVDRASSLYEPGVSCPHCYAESTPTTRQRARERHRQVELARQRGYVHLGEGAACALLQEL